MALSEKIAPRVAPGVVPVLQFAAVVQAWLEVLIQVVSVGTAAKVSEALKVNREAVRSRGFFTNERGYYKISGGIVLAQRFIKPMWRPSSRFLPKIVKMSRIISFVKEQGFKPFRMTLSQAPLLA